MFSSSPRIHLLLTDVVLQFGSGPTVARRLKAIDPGVRVLYTTGLPGPISPEVADGVGVPFIQKPFSRNALADKVRGVLGADNRSR